MNFFAHGRLLLDQPLALAGVCAPDWLRVVRPRVRIRRPRAAAMIDDSDPRVARFARGVVRHHDDDAWFHSSRAFVEMSLNLTVALRDLLPGDRGFRPSVVAHILVEMLLDAILIDREPDRLDAYYRTLASLSPTDVEAIAARVAGRPVAGLGKVVSRFVAVEFLYDYRHDEKLLHRLNRVITSVGLTELPPCVLDLLPATRAAVGERTEELIPPGAPIPKDAPG